MSQKLYYNDIPVEFYETEKFDIGFLIREIEWKIKCEREVGVCPEEQMKMLIETRDRWIKLKYQREPTGFMFIEDEDKK